jgi:hypothetical protein
LADALPLGFVAGHHLPHRERFFPRDPARFRRGDLGQAGKVTVLRSESFKASSLSSAARPKKLIDAIFGWAVDALFGSTRPGERPLLSPVVAAGGL